MDIKNKLIKAFETNILDTTEGMFKSDLSLSKNGLKIYLSSEPQYEIIESVNYYENWWGKRCENIVYKSRVYGHKYFIEGLGEKYKIEKTEFDNLINLRKTKMQEENIKKLNEIQ